MKNWLISNKIYFETVAATLLGIMAVIVSNAQLDIASEQTKLITAQLEIAKIQVEPNIHIKATLIKNIEKNYFDEDQIQISNMGTSAIEASSNARVFLIAKLNEKKSPFKSFEIKIALNGYYGGTGVTNNLKGLLFSIIGHQNNKHLGVLIRGFSELAAKNGFYSSLDIRRYVHVSYKNILGEPKERYYYVEPVSGPKQLSDNHGAEMFSQHSKLFSTPFSQEFSELTAKTIFDLLIDNEG